MNKTLKALQTVGIVAASLAVAGTPTGCGETKPGGKSGAGGSRGSGGITLGPGGATGLGGVVTLGSGDAGTGGSKGDGGTGGAGAGSGGMLAGTGGLDAGGAGAGGREAGGAGGRGTGGTGMAGADGGTKSGGTGGTATGDVGGTGGATTLDGGSPDAPLEECSELVTQAACDARGECHSVFDDPGTCGCVGAGCCARFVRCVDGGKANCIGPALCDMVEPFCELPYVVAYTDMCYEGCVQQSDCAIPDCPQAPPKDETTCGPVDHTCYYEDCAGAGRTLATCSAGAWTVQSAACSAFACQADDVAPDGLTCPAGMVCVITTHSGGALIVTPMCVEHACGTGPLTAQCMPSLDGTCTASYSLSGAIVQCHTQSDCGELGCP
ncbi:MAG: hypothetical protein JXP73_05400 [Deltaproteobacteria bacterium]|nr:hypothetical protein [Deltaproteobacteria bacterium]